MSGQMDLFGGEMNGQISLFDSNGEEPAVGEYVTDGGSIIPHIMRKSYIGKKVLIDVHTQSQNPLYQVGILEGYIPYEGRMRAIIFTGKKQRILETFYPGIEIREVEKIDRVELARELIGKRIVPAG